MQPEVKHYRVFWRENDGQPCTFGVVLNGYHAAYREACKMKLEAKRDIEIQGYSINGVQCFSQRISANYYGGKRAKIV